MRWYSIKKFIPATGREYLIRCESFDNYERYFIATIEFLDSIECFVNWDLSNDCHVGIDRKSYTVTHFCDIEPTEIEKE